MITRAWASLLLVSFASCASDGGIPAGEPIPGTSIVSCSGSQPPTVTGTLQDPTIDVQAESTLLNGRIVWQLACSPGARGEVDFLLDEVVLYENEAGYPGAEIGRTTTELRGVLGCDDVGGSAEVTDLDGIGVADLSGICASRRADPSGEQPIVHAALTGRAIDCRNQTHLLDTRRQTFFTCPDE